MYNDGVTRYARNSSAVFSLKFHLVWCPKYRRPVLTDAVAERLRALLLEKADEFSLTIHTMEIMPDHVHLFLECDPTFSVSEITNRLKGYTSRILMTEQKLVKFSWISASRGHSETPKTISCGNWHLFQNNLDRHWTLGKNQCKGGFSLDTNVQNPAHLYAGAWNMDGPVMADAARTQAIFDQRRFARCDASVYRAPDVNSGLIERQQCKEVGLDTYKLVPDQTVGASYNVRVLKEEGEWLLVDIDEDGVADGYCRKVQFTENFRTMPSFKRGQCIGADSHQPLATCQRI